MKRIIILVLYLLCGSTGLFGQSSPTLDKVEYNQITIPPSPQAASLSRYGEYSMSSPSGEVNVSIPLLNLEVGQGITIPIALNYSSSGLKVEERASWVGLGWSLSAGGVISRTCHGRPDDDVSGFLNNMTEIPNSQIFSSGLASTAFAVEVYERLKLLNENKVDYQPDIFTYTFPGHAGSFVFGNDGLPHEFQHTGIKIKPISDVSGISGWQVTDAEGIIYTFSDIERTFLNVQGADEPEYVSSWYLTRIDYPRVARSVTFQYESYDIAYTTPLTSQITYEASINGGFRGVGEEVPFSEMHVVDRSYSSSTLEHRGVKYVKTIILPNESVEFFSSEANGGSRKLDLIKWKTEQAEKSFTFNYDYFGNGERLKLLSLKEGAGSEVLVHNFDYYTYGSFPKLESKDQDHWGYYNGRRNQSMIPKVIYGSQELGDGANRDPDPRYAVNGMLSKITYPSQGTSTFIYEGNTYIGTSTIDDIAKVTSYDPLFVTGTSYKNGTQCTTQGFTISLEDSSDEIVELDGELRYTCEVVVNDNQSYVPQDHSLTVTIRDITDNKVVSEQTIVRSALTAKLALLKHHQYEFILCANSDVITASAQLYLYSYNSTLLGKPIDRISGGMRVKEIRNYTDESNKTEFKRYKYFGGYKTFFEPLYYSQCLRTDMQLKDFQRLLVYATPPWGVGPSPIAYEYVEELKGNENDHQGKTVTRFSIVEDEGHLGFPFIPQISNQWQRMPIEINYYNANGDLLKSHSLNYKDSVVTGVNGFKVARKNISEHQDFQFHQQDFSFENYSMYSRCKLLIEKKDVDYFDPADPSKNFRTNTINYIYEGNLHLNPSEEVFVNSIGDKIITTYKYPGDFSTCNYNDCYHQYLTESKACASLANNYTTEIVASSAAFSSCYSAYLKCKVDALDAQNTSDECGNHFQECLNTNYLPLVENIDNNYSVCQKQAFLNFSLCGNNVDGCLVTEYQQAINMTDKAISTMRLLNWNNILLEKTTKVNGRELSKIKYTYNLVSEINQAGPTSIGANVPVQREAKISRGQSPEEIVMIFNKYDENRNPLEVQAGVYGIKKSYLWGNNNSNVIAEVENASINDIAFTGFEGDLQEGHWTIAINDASDGTVGGVAQAKAGKTGKLSFALSNASINKTGLDPGKQYIVSYWASGSAPTVNNVIRNNDATEVEKDGWLYYEKVITGTSSISIIGEADSYIDELRLYPVGARMRTYSYEVGLGLHSETDFNNRTTFYGYDDLGRLNEVRNHDRDLLKVLKYNLKY